MYLARLEEAACEPYLRIAAPEHVEQPSAATLSATAESFRARLLSPWQLARSEGLEPPTSGFEARRSIRLS